MFEQTDHPGHLTYTKSMLVIVRNDYDEFIKRKEHMMDRDGIATQTRMIRMILLERYFWPDSVTFWTTVQSIFRAFQAKKRS